MLSTNPLYISGLANIDSLTDKPTTLLKCCQPTICNSQLHALTGSSANTNCNYIIYTYIYYYSCTGVVIVLDSVKLRFPICGLRRRRCVCVCVLGEGVFFPLPICDATSKSLDTAITFASIIFHSKFGRFSIFLTHSQGAFGISALIILLVNQPQIIMFYMQRPALNRSNLN